MFAQFMHFVMDFRDEIGIWIPLGLYKELRFRKGGKGRESIFLKQTVCRDSFGFALVLDFHRCFFSRCAMAIAWVTFTHQIIFQGNLVPLLSPDRKFNKSLFTDQKTFDRKLTSNFQLFDGN